MPVEQRVEAAAQWVLERVRYSVETETARRHASPELQGVSFVDRALAIGAGDCDVQNGVLVALLQDAGVTACLVVGYIGEQGTAVGLHAWAEYRSGPTSWKSLDLTARDAAELQPPLLATESSENSERSIESPIVLDPFDRGVSRFDAMSLLVALAVGVGAWSLLRLSRRKADKARLDPRFGLTSLLRGALERPEAFRETPEVFWRPLLPILPRGTVSLGEAWSLAERGRLYSARRRSTLPMHASRSRNRVLDVTRAESALVASALGAVPLDEWDERLSLSHSSPLLDTICRMLSHPGEKWHVRAASVSSSDARSGTRAVEGVTLHARSVWSGKSLSRYVIVNAQTPWLAACERRYKTRPAEAVFDCVDRLLDALGCPEPRRLELLAPLAKAAVREAVTQ
jgi:hypothetical protein